MYIISFYEFKHMNAAPHISFDFVGKVDLFFLIIDWLMLVILTSVALNTVGGTWDNFKKKTTTMVEELQEITDQPSITLCLGASRYRADFWHYFNHLLNYEKDFNITYSTSSDRLMTYVF